MNLSWTCILVILGWACSDVNGDESLLELTQKFSRCNGEDTGAGNFIGIGGTQFAQCAATHGSATFCGYRCVFEKLNILKRQMVDRKEVYKYAQKFPPFGRKKEMIDQIISCVPAAGLDSSNSCATTKKVYNCARNVYDRICAGYKGKGKFVNDDGTIEGDQVIVEKNPEDFLEDI